MKSYSTIVSGKEMSRFINLPDEFQEVDLKVVIRPIKKKKDRFAKLFLNPIRVNKITIPSKDEIHER
ncbi:MAG: hypothetical protein NT022_02280 [Deltaproteobacteria bacterium]|jgi:hypothetical protein|nr:hypothetical protein [Deltaproteobacteria bacterium]